MDKISLPANVLMVVVIRSEVHKHIFLGGVTLLS